MRLSEEIDERALNACVAGSKVGGLATDEP
jgi:hypothetical protein